jgi:hypothetical protein
MSIFSLFVTGTLILLASTGFAQYNTAEISGVVKDAQGGVLPGVTVTALHVASGLRVERTTDEAGRFFLRSLPVGEYTLSIELRGFKPFTQNGLMLAVGQKIDVPITLAVGQVSESVTITANAPLLQNGSAEVSDVISNRQVTQLPLNGRQYLQLAQLTDGIAIPPGGTRGAALEQGVCRPFTASGAVTISTCSTGSR